MTKTPTYEQYQYLLNLVSSEVPGEASSTVDKVRAQVNTPQARVAVHLKELYEMKKLPLLTALSKISFKSALPDQERKLSAFLDIVPTEEESADNNEAKNLDAPKLSVDHLSYPPSLPVISDKLLLIRVATDKSYRQASDFIESKPEKFANSHNAKLALRGRSTMELILLSILDEKYPNMYEEDLLNIRDRLMSLEVLAKFAFGYNLVDVMKYNLSVDVDDATKMEVCANIFLAYITGLQMDGYESKVIKLWLKTLYQPLISDLATSATPIAKVAFNEFQLLLKSIANVNRYPQSSVKYDILQVKTADAFIAQIIVGDEREVVGAGVSNTSFEDAEDSAVMEIMNDQEKVARIFTIIEQQYIRSRYGGSRVDTTNGSWPMAGEMQTRSQPSQATAAPLCGSTSSASSEPQPPHHSLYATTSGVQGQMPNQMASATTSHDQSRAMTRYGQHSPSPQPAYPHQPQEPIYGQQAAFGTSQGYPRSSPPCAYIPLSERRNDFQKSRHSYDSRNQQVYGQSAHGSSQANAQQDYDQQSYETIPLSHTGIDMRARADLNSILSRLQLKPEYMVTSEGGSFHALCTCEGIALGAGICTTKKKAAQKAAMAALSNRSALMQLGAIPQN
ncbi:hypothetical protein KGF57_000786 [Candida theae]|uniref:RNase III domain-containing protein n=1 Tax=Candida theae TaxID=1198502 RepID=A0AAD5G0D5_9ASCO|nr:uncharacterized protein KGF57_000786 [Candida theae]KAI5965520.1 hypothetical protein KGF57_000786 [Candida theae]